MGHEVLARKWRPKKFAELVGQDTLVRTLSHALEQKRFANAYLFTGPRGIGKTSVARILAKALNCEKPDGYEPCGQCVHCTEITRGNNMDVLEIDGASNRGIDQIRDLRDNAQFVAVSSQFKIYIIDEVHMLTGEAFNALLKTLEEPPSHVKFMFATTEPHRLPHTILSRCQRYDLHKISKDVMVLHLKKIIAHEKFQVEDEVFDLIAKVADGSLRDAESILDQLAVFSKGKILLQDALEMLGVAGQNVLHELVQAVIDADYVKCMALVEQVDHAGKDFSLLIVDWLACLRSLLLVRHLQSSTAYLNINADTLDWMKKVNLKVREERLLDWIDLVGQAVDKLRFTSVKRVLFEAVLVRSIRLLKLVSIDEIIQSIPHGGVALEEVVLKAEEKKVYETLHSPVISDRSLSEIWDQILTWVGDKKPLCRAYLNEAQLEQVDLKNWKIWFKINCSFHKEALSEKDNYALLKQAFEKVLNQDVNLSLDLLDGNGSTSESPARSEKKEKSWDNRLQNHSVVQKALEVFQGKIEDIN